MRILVVCGAGASSTFVAQRLRRAAAAAGLDWDAAAGMLLVREAGGFVSDFRGSDKSLDRGEYLAANEGLHSKLHKLLANALR